MVVRHFVVVNRSVIGLVLWVSMRLHLLLGIISISGWCSVPGTVGVGSCRQSLSPFLLGSVYTLNRTEATFP